MSYEALEIPLAKEDSPDMPARVRLVGSLPLVWASRNSIDVLMLTSRSAKRVQQDQVSGAWVEALLFYLALRCAPKARADTAACGPWLGKRTINIHATHADGQVCVAYDPIAPEEARDYLTALARDYFNRSSYDLLPLDLLGPKGLVAEACSSDDAAAYAAHLREVIEDDQEGSWKTYYPMRLLRIVDAQVPDDARDKVRRRFELLDRGPARLRVEKKGRAGG
jgi:hypothetical protein